MHKLVQQIILKEDGTKLAELIGIVANGEEVIIIKNDGSAFKIIAISHKIPYPKFGSAKGLVEISDDFDDPLEDFKEYIP